MLPLIEEIIEKFGPRPAASTAETNAQLFIQQKCAEFTDQTEFLPFDEYLDARFGKLKYYVALFFVSLALYWWLPLLSLAITIVSVPIMLLDVMMYRDVFTSFPGKKQTSSNVTATLEPKGPVKSTILVSAHMDSTFEYTWWHRFGHVGVTLTVLAGILLVMQLVFNLKHVIFPSVFDNYIWFAFLALSPLTIFYWSMIGDEAVPGAQDNLSGISIAFEVFKTFADKQQKGKSILKNTRLRFVSFGSEEKGLCGSRAYAALKKDELRKENAWLLNVDNIRVENEIAIIHKEITSGTTHSPVLVKRLQDSFIALNVPYKMAVAPIGGSDAVSLARVGTPGVTIIGMNAKSHDFTYHTREDKPEHIEPKALEKIKDTLLYFIRNWDEQNP